MSQVYLHADHPSAPLRTGLGSASLVTCGSATCGSVPNGGVVGELRYLPYGETRSGYPTGNVLTDRRFTGQRSEEAGLGSL